MTVAKPRPLTLEAFLQLPETKPPSEFIEGEIYQKPMPKTRHSRLQGKLTGAINQAADAEQIAYAFPELRCTYPTGSHSANVYGNRSIIPDIAVLRWSHIELDENDEPVDDVRTAPDWAIEILSPDQSANRVTGNLLHCLKHGCQLGWLVDPSDRSIIVFQPQKQPEFCHQADPLLVLSDIDLSLTVQQVFDWLSMKAS